MLTTSCAHYSSRYILADRSLSVCDSVINTLADKNIVRQDYWMGGIKSRTYLYSNKGIQYKARCDTTDSSYLEVKLKIESAETSETIDLTTEALTRFNIK